MNRYLKLVNFEFNRFVKIYVVLLAITLITQIIGVILKSREYVANANEAIYQEQLSTSEFLSQYGTMSFDTIVRSVWFLGPIALCAGAVAFYIFLIWYRDWFGKNTFIYRLLMLPTARLNVFLAKGTTILLVTLGFIGFQLIILPIETTILKWIVPKDFRVDMGVHEIIGAIPELHLIFPQSFIEFVLSYGAGMMVVFVLFTAILLERSFRWKGILMGVAYGVVALFIMLSPLLVQDFVVDGYFYISEMVLLEVLVGCIVIALSIWFSNYLLKRKIRV
ncbi:hypothetical protein [Oceanobacillus halotolerans]|uniref:hypothetical protein n=1 Tax=Oceanobacillus halotolerans TaxID=2663380 RepID=UPI0013DC0900|nr:hypothetical protein [Oceanobacillus halotolerans]